MPPGWRLVNMVFQANELTTKQIDKLNGYVSAKLVDLETGDYVGGDAELEKYNLVEEAANPATSIPDREA